MGLYGLGLNFIPDDMSVSMTERPLVPRITGYTYRVRTLNYDRHYLHCNRDPRSPSRKCTLDSHKTDFN